MSKSQIQGFQDIASSIEVKKTWSDSAKHYENGYFGNISCS
jgi:hypothetical protein